LREWVHFFTLRTSNAAHPQMREIAIPLLYEFQKQIPIIFDDLKIIMVIKREILFSKKRFTGFIEPSSIDFESIILSNYEWMQQENAESNHSYKQPIGYTIICNPRLKKVFIYRRSSKDENYKEKRLQGKYSCGVGGHIDIFDSSATNPITASTLREISEEVDLKVSKNIKNIGYINNEDEVGSVHFGILYIVETNAENVTPIDSEIENGEFVDIKKFEELCNNPNIIFEEWAKIALEPIKKYLSVI